MVQGGPQLCPQIEVWTQRKVFDFNIKSNGICLYLKYFVGSVVKTKFLLILKQAKINS